MNELNPQSSTGTPAVRSVAPAKEVARATEDEQTDKGGKQLPPVTGNKLPDNPPEPVEQAVTKLNDFVQSMQRDLKFTVDPELGRPVVSVIDSNTQQVIRQIPNDVVIRLARNLNEELSQASEQALQENLSDGFSGSAASQGAYGSAAAGIAEQLQLINTKV